MAESVEELKAKIKLYEQNGIAKLYYALNRKCNEMGDLLNKVNLSDIKLDDKDNKTFERMKVVWNDAASIATAVETLGKSAGITGNEQEDIGKRPFIETVAETRQ